MRADSFRVVEDFELVIADERTVDRHAHGIADGGHVVQSLRRDLGQAVSRDEAEEGVAVVRNALGNPATHHPAV